MITLPLIKSGWYTHNRHGCVFVVKSTSDEGIIVRKGHWASETTYGKQFVVSRASIRKAR